jgi:hypothetical protein
MLLFFVFIPLLMVWFFAIFDVFARRDLSGWGKAAWLVAIIVLPWLGTLVYLIFRPWGESAYDESYPTYTSQTAPAPMAQQGPTDQLQALANLHASGAIDDQEYAKMKARVIGDEIVPA